MKAMDLLKLIAMDDDDLKVISAHLQDAILRTDDIAYIARDRRFVSILRRFDWAGAENGAQKRTGYERRQCALRVEHVKHAQFKNLPLEKSDDGVLSLLAIDFAPTDDVAGHITLIFAGGGAIRLEVDCIEAELRDLGPIWKTRSKPQHPLEDAEMKLVK